MLRSKQLKLVMLVIALSLLVTCGLAANKRILINDEEVQFTSASGFPFIDSAERTQVPFRATLEKFGATVSFDSTTSIAIAEKDGIKVEVPIGKKQILRNGVVIPVDTAGLIKDSRTYLPIRAVMEAFGCEVDWDGAKDAVSISFSGEKDTDTVIEYEQFFNYEILYIINGELISVGNEGDLIILNSKHYGSGRMINCLLGVCQNEFEIREVEYNQDIKILSPTELDIKFKIINANSADRHSEMVFRNTVNNKEYIITYRQGYPNQGKLVQGITLLDMHEVGAALDIDMDYEIEIDREVKTITFTINGNKVADEYFTKYEVLYQMDGQLISVGKRNYAFGILDGRLHTGNSITLQLLRIFQGNFKISEHEDNPYISVISSTKVDVDVNQQYTSATDSYDEITYNNTANKKEYIVTSREGDINQVRTFHGARMFDVEEVAVALDIELNYQMEIDREEKTVTFIINE